MSHYGMSLECYEKSLNFKDFARGAPLKFEIKMQEIAKDFRLKMWYVLCMKSLIVFDS